MILLNVFTKVNTQSDTNFNRNRISMNELTANLNKPRKLTFKPAKMSRI